MSYNSCEVKRTVRNLALIAFVLLTSLSWKAVGQDAVPTEIMQRTIFIKVGNEAGTAFAVDYQGRMYLVTARHVVAGLPATNATIQVWQDEQWKDYKTVRTIFPTNSDVDIAVFETAETVTTPYAIKPNDGTGGATMGQQLWFLGYPFGIASHFQDGKRAPFMKRGTMSAIDATHSDAVVIYIDGFNNPEFSGGPLFSGIFQNIPMNCSLSCRATKRIRRKSLLMGSISTRSFSQHRHSYLIQHQARDGCNRREPEAASHGQIAWCVAPTNLIRSGKNVTITAT